MNVLTIIPARSGSKGVKDKNICRFLGFPLLHHVVKASTNSTLVSRTIVSTDSSSYQELCINSGAEAPFLRPTDISGDTASSESALLHTLEWLADHENYVPDIVVFLQCTSPLTSTDDIDGCVKLVMSGQFDCAFTATASHAFIWKRSNEGAVGLNHDSLQRLRRQDMEPEYRETGACYVMKTKGFLKAKHRFFGHIGMHEVPRWRSWEIDDETDWMICESLAKRSLKNSHSPFSNWTPRALVFDFDGVFTDNRVWTSEDGIESVACSRSDGLRMSELHAEYPEIELLILSKEPNKVVLSRAKKLVIPVLHGVDDKLGTLQAWLDEHALAWEDIVYVGNDLNDLECIQQAGCGVAVADAYPDVINEADLVLEKKGGHGAVRELVDMLLIDK